MVEIPYAALQEAASQASRYAYAPYNRASNGAALLTKEGEIFTGATIQTANWSSGICAAQAAITKAVNAGYKDFLVIAIVGTGVDAHYLCGGCRQLLAEFDLDVVVVSEIDPQRIEQLRNLLPYTFSLNDSPKT